MPVKAIITGVLLVLMVVLLVSFIEYFLPLSVKADMDMLCRGTLLRMENVGGLRSDEEEALNLELGKIGLTGIDIDGSPYAKQGRNLNLRVEGYYTYSKLRSLFKREDVTVHMVYDKTTMSRKLVN
jgi:hypothetical protein